MYSAGFFVLEWNEEEKYDIKKAPTMLRLKCYIT